MRPHASAAGDYIGVCGGVLGESEVFVGPAQP